MGRFVSRLSFAIGWLVVITLLSSPLANANESEELEEFDESDEAMLRQLEAKHVTHDMLWEQQLARELSQRIAAARDTGDVYGHPANGDEGLQYVPHMTDPCKGVRCGAGRVCTGNNPSGTAECVCIPECPKEYDPRRKVCTNLNETWDSACEVHRQRCLCNTNDPQCRGEEIRHVHINYYGYCKEMPPCAETDLADFPRRMRDWLFNVMRDLATRNELPEPYMELEHEAETNMTKRWTNAAIWKWCDLDGHPHDNTVSRHELFPIRAPLMALEHCIAPFLESCDPNRDHRISLQEWGKCLELEEEDLTARCAEIIKDDEFEKNDMEAAAQ